MKAGRNCISHEATKIRRMTGLGPACWLCAFYFNGPGSEHEHAEATEDTEIATGARQPKAFFRFDRISEDDPVCWYP